MSTAIEKALADKKNPVAREGACMLLQYLCDQGCGHAVEPFVFEKVFPLLVSDTFADKTTGVRTAAVNAVLAFTKVMSPWAAALMLPTLLREIEKNGKWQVKVGGLQVIDQLVSSAAPQIAAAMPSIIPVLAATM